MREATVPESPLKPNSSFSPLFFGAMRESIMQFHKFVLDIHFHFHYHPLLFRVNSLSHLPTALQLSHHFFIPPSSGTFLEPPYPFPSTSCLLVSVPSSSGQCVKQLCTIVVASR